MYDRLYNLRVVDRIRTAELVSEATRLPFIVVPLFLLLGYSAAGGSGLLWGALCIFLTSGLSLLYLLHLTRSGKVRDPRRIGREERVRPLWIVAGLHASAWLVLTLLGAPAVLRAVLLSYVLATLAFALLTPVVKISLHAAGVSGATVCLLFVFGWWGALAAPLLPVVWWARSALGRHTPPELALGSAVGGGSALLAFFVLL